MKFASRLIIAKASSYKYFDKINKISYFVSLLFEFYGGIESVREREREREKCNNKKFLAIKNINNIFYTNHPPSSSIPCYYFFKTKL